MASVNKDMSDIVITSNGISVSICTELLRLIKHMKHPLIDAFSRADGLTNGLILRGQLFWRTCP